VTGRVALPKYCEQVDRTELSPGQRFASYLALFNPAWTMVEDAAKRDALRSVCSLSKHLEGLSRAARARYSAEARRLGDDALTVSARSISPFTTGLGIEHPTENGFAFARPYGLPLLPGSSVKGVLRRAAEELALEAASPDGWTWLDVWWLFGFEGAGSRDRPAAAIFRVAGEGSAFAEAFRNDIPELARREDAAEFVRKMTKGGMSDPAEFFTRLCDDAPFRGGLQWRGALDLWDVLPDCSNLVVEVMTPHHSGYLQGAGTPHDGENPNPILFLAVPTGTNFEFVVRCHASRLPQRLVARWRVLVEAAFQHAFDWLGFGAKTAVGYGALGLPPPPPPPPAALATSDDLWAGAEVKFERGQYVAVSADRKLLAQSSPDARLLAVLEASLADAAQRLRKGKKLTFTVRVQKQGNKYTLLEVLVP
jgi:CRISPR-associated protein Cmr6